MKLSGILAYLPFTAKVSDALSSRKKGASGEALAIKYLRRKGLKILDKNFRTKFGEIDIICSDGGQIVFVEVKSSSSRDFEDPLNWISQRKQRKIIKVSMSYIKMKGLIDKSVRYDAIGIRHDGKIEHIKDAFRPTEAMFI